MKTLKQTFLSLDYFIDNKFLDFYCSLIENNKNNEQIVGTTQKHHIIPRCYYKYKKLPTNENSDNLINLIYTDHILAHYYLALCTEGKIRYANIKALQYCFADKDYLPKGSNKELNKLKEQLPYLQQLYEECYSKQKGKTRIYNEEGISLVIYPDEINTYLNNGWMLGMPDWISERMKKGQQKQSAKDARKRGHITHAKNIEKRKQEGELILVPNLAKPVICLELNKTFSSIKEAKLWLGRGDVEACANRVQRVAGNYHWAFCDDKEWIESQIQHMNETKERYNKIINQNKRPGNGIVCIELNKEFASVTEAIAWLRSQYKKGDIYGAAKFGTTAGGYHWKLLPKSIIEWTEEEIEILKNKFPIYGKYTIKFLNDKTIKDIWKKAKELNIETCKVQKGKLCYNNGKEHIYILQEDIEYFENLGYQQGMIPRKI